MVHLMDLILGGLDQNGMRSGYGLESDAAFLPALASEQGNVIGLVSMYIYSCHQIFFCN